MHIFKSIYLPTAIGVFFATLIVALFAYSSIIYRNYEDWLFVRDELVFGCMNAPTHQLKVCERYADWALKLIPAYNLRNCYERFELRKRASYPSMAVCTSIFKVSFATWASSPNRACVGSGAC